MAETNTKHGLFASLRQLLGSVVETAQVRLSLISTEIEQEKLRLFDGLLMTVLALMLLGLGLLMLCGFIVVLFWDSYRLQTLAALALLFLGAGTWLLVKARARLQQPGGLFNSSVTELERDLASLRTHTTRPS